MESFDAGHCNFQVGNQFQAHNKALFCGVHFQYDLTGTEAEVLHVQSFTPH